MRSHPYFHSVLYHSQGTSADFPQAWDLLQLGSLFDGRDANGKDSLEHKLAELIALLGPPPKHLLERSEVASEYFDEHGQCLFRRSCCFIDIIQARGRAPWKSHQSL